MNNTTEKVQLIKNYWDKYFKNLKTDYLFYPKFAYIPKNKTELYVSFFPSELRQGKDFYTEVVDKNYNVINSQRVLLKWRYNPHWKEEYEMTHPEDINNTRYLIPLAEFVEIKSKEIVSDSPLMESISDFSFMLNNKFTDLTARDYFCLLHLIPASNSQEINDFIIYLKNKK